MTCSVKLILTCLNNQFLKYFVDLFIKSEGCSAKHIVEFGNLIAKILLVKKCLTFFGTPDIYHHLVQTEDQSSSFS